MLLHGFAVYIIFMFLQSMISEDGRLHRFVCHLCCVLSSSLRCVQTPLTANKVFSRPTIALKPLQLSETRSSGVFSSYIRPESGVKAAKFET